MTVSIRRRPTLVLAVAVMLLVSFIAPPPLYALPEKSVIDYFWSGCTTSRVYLGMQGVECDGAHPDDYPGTPYKWRFHEELICWENENCGDFCNAQSWYAEKCSNGTLRYVTESEFNAGVCTC